MPVLGIENHAAEITFRAGQCPFPQNPDTAPTTRPTTQNLDIYFDK